MVKALVWSTHIHESQLLCGLVTDNYKLEQHMLILQLQSKQSF